MDLDQRGKNLNGKYFCWTQIDFKLLLAWMAIPHYLTECRLDHKPDWPQNNIMKCTNIWRKNLNWQFSFLLDRHAVQVIFNKCFKENFGSNQESVSAMYVSEVKFNLLSVCTSVDYMLFQDWWNFLLDRFCKGPDLKLFFDWWLNIARA